MVAIREVKKEKLNNIFIEALDVSHDEKIDCSQFPMKFDIKNIKPRKCILYIWQITDPPGGRSIDENKIQLILPGQKRDERANFTHESDYFTLLVGYRDDIKIFCLWDAYLYENIPFSRNVQVKEKTLFVAISGGIQIQNRKLWVGPEKIITTNTLQLKKAISLRYDMYLGIYE